MAQRKPMTPKQREAAALWAGEEAHAEFVERSRRDALDLALMGGISSHTLHLGTREEVVAESRAAMETAAEPGSILVGCSNQIVAGNPAANIEAMVETMDRYRLN